MCTILVDFGLWAGRHLKTVTFPRFLDRVVPPDQNFEHGYCGVFRCNQDHCASKIQLIVPPTKKVSQVPFLAFWGLGGGVGGRSVAHLQGILTQLLTYLLRLILTRYTYLLTYLLRLTLTRYTYLLTYLLRLTLTRYTYLLTYLLRLNHSRVAWSTCTRRTLPSSGLLCWRRHMPSCTGATRQAFSLSLCHLFTFTF